MSHTHGQGFVDQIAELEAKLAQQAEAQEPCAWAVYWGVGEMRRNSVHFEYKSAMEAASHIRSVTEIRPLFTRPQPATDERIAQKQARIDQLVQEVAASADVEAKQRERIAELEAERDSLREVNAELLEAMKQIIADMDSDFGTGYDYDKARAAIARKQENTK